MGLPIPDLRRLLYGGGCIESYMTKTYIINVRQLETKAVFEEALACVSLFRRQKIAHLKQQKDKNRSLGAALALHKALQGYGLEERDMEYDLGEQGKPALCHYPEIRFSLSHAGDYAICSIGEAENGNDIEWVRSGKENLAKRFFAEEELAWMWQAAYPAEREERMFRIWTMKESFLKVTGLGMSLPLRDFAVLIEEGDKISLRQTVNSTRYYMKEYMMPKEYEMDNKYKIAVCCVAPDFAPELEKVVY